jgi:hypothetical protein
LIFALGYLSADDLGLPDFNAADDTAFALTPIPVMGDVYKFNNPAKFYISGE